MSAVPDITKLCKNMDELPVQNGFVDQVAAALSRRGLQTPALIFLETGHPLTFLGGQLLWVAQPALSLFVSAEVVADLAHLLEEPEAVKALAARLATEKAEKA